LLAIRVIKVSVLVLKAVIVICKVFMHTPYS